MRNLMKITKIPKKNLLNKSSWMHSWNKSVERIGKKKEQIPKKSSQSKMISKTRTNDFSNKFSCFLCVNPSIFIVNCLFAPNDSFERKGNRRLIGWFTLRSRCTCFNVISRTFRFWSHTAILSIKFYRFEFVYWN